MVVGVRWGAALLAITLAVGGCSGDPGERHEDRPGSSRELVLELDGGARIIAPVGAFPAGTELEIATEGAPDLPPVRMGLQQPIDVTAGGVQPDLPITLEFPYAAAHFPRGLDLATVMGVSTYDETSGRWQPLPVTFDQRRQLMIATSPTLSWKWPWEWDWAGIGVSINQHAGELIGKRAPAADCHRGIPVPRWVLSAGTSNDDGVALRSCAEGDKGALVLELVNNRPYGVVMQVDAPTRWTWVAEPEDPAELLVKLFLDQTLRANELYIPPLGRATVALKKGRWSSAQLSTDANGATVLGSYLALAFGEVVTKTVVSEVATAMASSCLSDFVRTNGEATVDALTDVRSLVSASLSCVTEVLEGRVLDRTLTPDQRGRAAGAYRALGRVSFWLKLFSVEWNTVDLIFDQAFVAGPSTIPVYVRRPLLSASATGLGPWDFGEPATSVLPEMDEWFGSSDIDTSWLEFHRLPGYDGWFEGDQLSGSWAYPVFRAVCWQALCALFGGTSSGVAAFRGWELSTFHYWGDGYREVEDSSEPRIALEASEIQLGDTWTDFHEAYPSAVPGGGEGGSLVIDNPPWPGVFDGVWGWRMSGQWDFQRPKYAPPDATITRMSGGEGPEPGCC